MTGNGAEATLGYLYDSQFRITGAEQFEEDELAEIQQAARNVLIHALGGATATPNA